MKKYTVILIYPDYLADNYGEEFYIAHVEAETTSRALALAQKYAFESNGGANFPEDFALCAIFHGHLEDVSHLN